MRYTPTLAWRIRMFCQSPLWRFFIVWGFAAGSALAADLPAYQANDCPPAFPPNATCGELTVHENHTTRSGETRLPIVWLHPPVTLAAPAIILGGGGPGGGLWLDNGEVMRVMENYRQAINQDGALLLIDQRGAGKAKPHLGCMTEFNEAWQKSILRQPLTFAEEFALIVSLVEQCQQRLTASGIDLTAYTTANSADDISDLRQALALPPLNLVGFSYGARLALKVMQRHPTAVRAALLDSLPPFDLAILPPAFPFAAAINRLDDRCTADDDCRQRFGSVADNLQRVTENLAAQTPTIRVRYNSENLSIALTPRRLLDIIHSGLYREEGSAVLPLLSKKLLQGEYNTPAMEDLMLIDYLDFIFDEQWADMLYLHIVCHEDIIGNNLPAPTNYIKRHMAESTQAFERLCHILWPNAQPLPQTPVHTDHPILIISGRLDPTTPTEWAEAALPRLPNAQLLVVPFSHTPSIGHACLQKSIGDFFASLSSVQNYCYNESPLSFF